MNSIQSSITLLTMWLLVLVGVAQSEQPIKRTLQLTALEHSPTRCQLGIESQFLDNTSLLISNPICTRGGVESSYQIAVVSLDGTIRTSINLDGNSRYPHPGPVGYIFIPAGGKGWLIFDEQLHRLGDVPARAGESEGEVVLSPSRTAVAVIFTRADGYSYPWRSVVLAGQPLENKGEYTIPAGWPMITDSGSFDTSKSDKARLFMVSSDEQWFFDKTNHHLSRWSPNGGSTMLPNASWLAPDKTETWCSGQLSSAKTRRFLAHCNGNTMLGIGKASIGWGHNRFVVYDAEGKTLFKKAVPRNSSISLSPDGHLIAVSHQNSIDLYDLH